MKRHLRLYIQAASAFILNSYWYFPISRRIYQSRLKFFCSPGLNCYSCPAATSACPIGAIQNFLGAVGPSLEAARYHLGLYVIGWLGIIGGMVGRMPCGWICPFGLIQDFLSKASKRKHRLPHIFTYGPYVVLALAVVMLPLLITDSFGYGLPWFCKFICPAGTLEAGLPLLVLQPALRTMIGYLFYSKVSILFIIIVLSVFITRFFCRTICPLGAIYSLFNRGSLFRLTFDPDKCKHCGQCHRDCPMDIRVYESPNDRQCIRCLICLRESCAYGAISYEIGKDRRGEKEVPSVEY
ncbi:MAG: 4Fe-4S binding protein [Pseudomonadota bacterium]